MTESKTNEQALKRKTWRFLSPEDRADLVWFFRWAEDEIANTRSSAGVALDHALKDNGEASPAPLTPKDAEELRILLLKLRTQAMNSPEPMFDDLDADDVRVRSVSRYRRLERILAGVMADHPGPAYPTLLRSAAAEGGKLPEARYFDVRSTGKYICCFCGEILEKDSLAVFYPEGMNLPPDGVHQRRWESAVMAHGHCHDEAFKEDVAARAIGRMREWTVGRALLMRLYHAYVRPPVAFGLETDDEGNIVAEQRRDRTVNHLASGQAVEVVRADERHPTTSWRSLDEKKIPGLLMFEGDGEQDEQYRDELEEACNAFRNARYAVDTRNKPQNFVGNDSE